MRRTISSPSAEFAGADLGDERLTRRLMRLANCFAVAPAASFPRLTTSPSELEGVYRFLSNGQVTPERILAPHFARTVERVGRRTVLAVHDTTELAFGGLAERSGLGRINEAGEKKGFFAHVALAVAADDSRQPLGVAGLHTFVRQGEPTAKARHARKAGEPNEQLKWTALAVRVEGALPGAIHVMDREADSYEIADCLHRKHMRFVIRVCRDRRQLDADGETKLFAAADKAPVFARRTVPLSRRRGRTFKPDRKIHPPRAERTAELQIRASSHTIVRPMRPALENCSETLTVNVVTVEEVNVPPGVDPISWRLLTTEPIDTAEQVEAVLDSYRARWVIEEYFKALKTGCAIEKRQLESFRALANALAVFLVLAWRLLLLRAVARATPAAPASSALTDRQIVVLSQLSRLKHERIPRVTLPPTPTAQEALAAVAQLGGHLKKNGDPGWLVLGRGLEALLLVELGWIAKEEAAGVKREM